MITHRVMKGQSDKILLPGVDVRTAVLRGGGRDIALDVGDQCVTIREESLVELPVPHEMFGELECVMVINDSEFHNVIITADPERPSY